MLELVFYAVAFPVIYMMEREAKKGQQPLPFDPLLGGVTLTAIALVGVVIVTYLFY
ncbi:MAG: hypothetical protein LBP87_06080 [Planctomycetaceae bacterium]|jgi:hypothetical protein|nr:hypothetical protein [Planctomycetaceae bacterium]